MAGDYEYYAAQGRQPLAFAVAELVDNALRATAGSIAIDQATSASTLTTSASSQSLVPPRIEVTVALDSDKHPTAGLVSVWDNGAGMSKAALNAWAVMNLAVSERADEGGGGGVRGGAKNDDENVNVSSSPALAPAPDALASARHLNGDLSYFGVGSKNAAFFLGRRVGVATSRRGEGVVRELALDAAALEARYQAAAAAAARGSREEAVYADDLVHRDPGDPSTLVIDDAAAPLAASAAPPPAAAALALLRSLERRWVAAEPAGEKAPSAHWTRVTVSSLKAPVLQQLAEDRGGTRLCGALAHLYHYYLHGARGRTKKSNGSGGGGESDNSDSKKTTAASNPLPDIFVRGVVAGKPAWECRLADVQHDLESRSLAAAAAEFEFLLHVPGKASAGPDGVVAGVLRYFPFEGERETVPDAVADADAAAAAAAAAAACSKNNQKKRPASGNAAALPLPPPPQLRRRSSGGGSDIAGGAIDMTQVGSGALTQRMQQQKQQQLTQADFGAAAAGAGVNVSAIEEEGDEEAAAVADPEALASAAAVDEHADPTDADNDDADDAAVAAAANAAALARLRGPCLEAFWQGRLIPGARVESLPFVDAVRARAGRAGGAARDAVPDEVFGRLRGALFFGPAWLVTRNKLTFRDDLRGLLAEATGEGGGGAGGRRATTAAVANGGASLERRFREWLSRCHATLDKRVRYDAPAAPRVQAAAREAHGEGITAFEKASEGGVAAVASSSSSSTFPPPNSTAYSAGDLVRLAVKPAIVGEILYFHVPVVGAPTGAHGGGFVTVAPLPEKLWGGVTRTFPFRRLTCSSSSYVSEGEGDEAALTTRSATSAHVSEVEAAAHVARELSRAPSAARLVEPLRLAAGGGGNQRLSLAAGATLPETGVAALAGGSAGACSTATAAVAASRVTKAMLGGKRVSLVMVQRLWFLGGDGNGGGKSDGAEAMDEDDTTNAEAEAPSAAVAAAAASKRQPRRGVRKGKGTAAGAAAEEEEGGGEEAAAPATAAATISAPSASRTLVLEVENRTPSRDGLFRFSKVSDGLKRAGRYELEYELLPRLPGGPEESSRIAARVPVDIAPGPAASLEASGPGRAAASAAPLPLGAPLPALELVYRDEFGNAARPPRGGLLLKGVSLSVVRGGKGKGGGEGKGAGEGGAGGGEELISDLRALSTAVDATASGATLSRVRVVGAEGVTGGVSIFSSSVQGEGVGSDDGDDEPRAAQRARDGGGSALLGPASVSLLVSAPLSGSSSSSSKSFSSAAAAAVSVRLPLRLLPGAPVALRISEEDGASPPPRSSISSLLAAGIPAGAPLPAFSVCALDAWGNRTAPLEGVFGFELEASSPLVELAAGGTRFAFDACGTARIEGLTAVAAADPCSSPPLVLSLVVKPLCPAAADAVDGAGPTVPLSLPMSVQPSRAPARLQLLLGGEPLPTAEEGGARGAPAAADGAAAANNNDNDDDAPSARLAGVPAGASVSGLSLRVLDAGGRPCDPSHPGGDATGKLQVSWMRGHKKVKASDLAGGGGGGGEDGSGGSPRGGGETDAAGGLLPLPPRGLITLPPLEAPERVGVDASFWVRLKFSGRGAPLLEAGLTVSCSPGAPRSWQLRLVDGGKSGNGNGDFEGGGGAAANANTAAAANNKASSPSSSEGDVFADVPFVLEVEALDEFANRCPFDAAAFPMPKLSVARLPGGGGSGGGGNGGGGRGRRSNNVSSSSDASASAPWLECDPSTWEGAWKPISSSAGVAGEPLGDVFTARGVVRGSTGRLLLEVRDDDDESSSTLSPDALELTLGPGPPATLAFDPLPGPFASKAASTTTKTTTNAAAGSSRAAAASAAAAAANVPTPLGLALALPPLTVRVLDACGNPVTCGPLANGADVALLPGALATDGTGRAAAVTAASAAVSSNGGPIVAASAAAAAAAGGAIKARLVDGVATFENVRVSAAVASAAAGGGSSKPSKRGGAAATATAASDPFSLARAAAAAAAVSGSYALRAKPASRSLAAAFGELEIFLAPSSAVVRVSIRGGAALPGNGSGGGGVEQLQQARGGGGRGKAATAAAAAAVPASSSATLVAGSIPTFIVDVATEDGVPLSPEVAAAGLRLCLIEQSSGGGGDDGGIASTPSALEASAPVPFGSEPGTFAISSADSILKSGRYAVSAEWSEPREELAAATRWRAETTSNSDRNASSSSGSSTLLRSTAVELVVSAGPAVSLVLDPAPGSAAGTRQQQLGKRKGGGGSRASNPAPPPPPSLTASNGGDEAARSVLPRPVALQLVDAHGNAVDRAGVKVRLALVLASAAAGGGGGDSNAAGGRGKRAAAPAAPAASSIPLLEGAASEEHETDERGRAFIGPVRIAEGTGGGGGGEGACSLDLRLVALMTKTTATAEEENGPESTNTTEAFSLPLLFTDGGALAEAIAAAAAERGAAAEARNELEAKVEEARAAASAAERDAAAASRAVAAARRAVGGGRSAPDSPGTARKALEATQQRRAEEASAVPGARGGKRQQQQKEQQQLLQQLDLAASHGPSGKPMTKSIDACLADGGASSSGSGASAATISGAVGVVARLATVDDARLSAVLAAQYRGLLPVVVVKDPASRNALAAARSGDALPTPDILSLTHVQPFRAAGPVPEDAKSRSILLPHRNKSASALARALVAAACQGSDAPLPFPLPHAKVLLAHGARMKAQHQQQQQRGNKEPSSSSAAAAVNPNALVAAAPPKGVPAADEWPEGCLGYAFNLLRPTKKGARAALLYPLLGQTLVFESLETGSRYREHLATRLRAGCGDIVSLDGGRVSSKGVTSGSSFAVPPAASVPWRFGSTPANQRPRIHEEEEEEEVEEQGRGADNSSTDPAALEALVAALEARAGAEARLGDARERSARVAGRLLPRIEAAARAVEEAEARMQELRIGTGGGGTGNGGGGAEEAETSENDENEAPAAAAARGGGGGGKRRAPLQLEASKTPQAVAGASKGNSNNNNNNSKRLRKMAG